MRHVHHIPRPRVRPRRLHGLGYPILPDQFTTAAGVSEAFSPQTPDAIMMQILAGQNQQLPPDLAAAWAAAQSGNVPTVTTTPIPSNVPPQYLGPPVAITPSGAPISTQTGAGLRLMNIDTLNGVPGVYVCTMSDGSSHYCDVDGNAISYTRPAATPATTPAAGSQPTSTVVSPPASSTPAPIAVTPSGVPISTTSGTPTAAAPAGDIMIGSFDLSSLLFGSAIAGIPNWVFLAGGAALFFLSGDSSSPRRR